MRKKQKTNRELYIKQGRAYQALLKKANAKGNQAKIREIERKLALIK